MTSPVSALEAIERAMEGVTPGPWRAAGGYLTTRDPDSASFRKSIYHLDEFGQEAPHLPFQAIPFSRAQDAAFIAACSPDRMREVLALARQAEALERENAEKDARIAALESGLEPFAQIADDFDADGRDLKDTDGIYANVAGDFRRARALLGGSGNAE